MKILNEATTMREMCEYISAALATTDQPMTPKQVWEISPSGELWPIMTMYWEIKFALGEVDLSDPPCAFCRDRGQLLACFEPRVEGCEADG